MNKGSTGFIMLAALAAGVGIYFMNKGTAAKNLRFIADGIKIQKGVILFTLKIFNGSNSPINIDSIIGDLIFQDSAVGVVSYQTPTTIQGNSEKRISFKITPDLTGVGKAIFNLLLSKEKKKYNFIFKGVVNAEGLIFDFEQNYSL